VVSGVPRSKTIAVKVINNLRLLLFQADELFRTTRFISRELLSPSVEPPSV